MRPENWIEQNASMLSAALQDMQLSQEFGRVTRVVGTIIHAALPSAKLGDLCRLHSKDGGFSLEAEIVGFDEEGALLTPIGEMRGLSP